eukprot:scaffold397_cov395-Pavlova_lutheri.AAC.3
MYLATNMPFPAAHEQPAHHEEMVPSLYQLEPKQAYQVEASKRLERTVRLQHKADLRRMIPTMDVPAHANILRKMCFRRTCERLEFEEAFGQLDAEEELSWPGPLANVDEHAMVELKAAYRLFLQLQPEDACRCYAG